MRRLGRFTHRAEHQSSASFVEKPHQAKNKSDHAIDQRMLLEECSACQGDISQKGNFKARALGQLFLDVPNAHKGRKSDAKQTERQARCVLIGSKIDHQQAKNGGQHGTRGHACQKSQTITAGMNHGGKSGNGGTQHHAFSPQIDHARFFIDQQTQSGDGQHGTRIERRSHQQCIRFHHTPLLCQRRR